MSRQLTIGIVAPGRELAEDVPARVMALAAERFGARAPELRFHPQCFERCGHFAGPDAIRAEALLDYANDPAIDAIWFARGGYGAGRIVEQVLPKLGPAAHEKTWLGYSDAGFLLGALDAFRIGKVAHGPMPADIARADGEAAVARALDWLVDRNPHALEPGLEDRPSLAFNLTVLGALIGTPWQPDFTGRVLIVEEIAEYMYRIDRALGHVTANANVRAAAGLRLGRCSEIPANDPDFELDEEQVARHWCEVSGIAWLGRADIGHDAANKVVPFS